jgi:hypothetical protein
MWKFPLIFTDFLEFPNYQFLDCIVFWYLQPLNHLSQETSKKATKYYILQGQAKTQISQNLNIELCVEAQFSVKKLKKDINRHYFYS